MESSSISQSVSLSIKSQSMQVMNTSSKNTDYTDINTPDDSEKSIDSKLNKSPSMPNLVNDTEPSNLKSELEYAEQFKLKGDGTHMV